MAATATTPWSADRNEVIVQVVSPSEEDDDPTSTPSHLSRTEIPSYGTVSTVVPQTEGISPSDQTIDVVDSALQAALREPRERVALLRLETLLVDFCNSDAGWLEVTGPYNSFWIGQLSRTTNGTSSSTLAPGQAPPRPATSFQRCILHRLADRFGIIRENGSVIEGSIRLIKLPETKIPARLLQDLQPSEYALQPQPSEGSSGLVGGVTEALSQATLGDVNPSSATTSFGNSAANASSTLGTITPQPIRSRKMKIMKRSDDRSRSSTPSHSNGSADRKSLLKKSGTSSADLSEKEKAYAEARARIFSDEATDDNTTNQDTNAELDETTPVSTPAIAFAAAAALQSPLRSSVVSNASVESAGTNTESITTTTTTENKATYRNRVEEAADPDFQRGVGVLPLQHPTSYYGPSAIPSSTTTFASTTSTGVPVPYAQQPLMVSSSAFTNNHSAASAPTAYALPCSSSSNGATRTTAATTKATTNFVPPLSADTMASSSLQRALGSNTNSNNNHSSSVPKLAANAPAFYPRWATGNANQHVGAANTTSNRPSSSATSTAAAPNPTTAALQR